MKMYCYLKFERFKLFFINLIFIVFIKFLIYLNYCIFFGKLYYSNFKNLKVSILFKSKVLVLCFVLFGNFEM